MALSLHLSACFGASAFFSLHLSACVSSDSMLLQYYTTRVSQWFHTKLGVSVWHPSWHLTLASLFRFFGTLLNVAVCLVGMVGAPPELPAPFSISQEVTSKIEGWLPSGNSCECGTTDVYMNVNLCATILESITMCKGDRYACKCSPRAKEMCRVTPSAL